MKQLHEGSDFRLDWRHDLKDVRLKLNSSHLIVYSLKTALLSNATVYKNHTHTHIQ